MVTHGAPRTDTPEDKDRHPEAAKETVSGCSVILHGNAVGGGVHHGDVRDAAPEQLGPQTPKGRGASEERITRSHVLSFPTSKFSYKKKQLPPGLILQPSMTCLLAQNPCCRTFTEMQTCQVLP